ncbi:hypothetical protein ACFL2B_00175 [Patescibacteria group bacterium]
MAKDINLADLRQELLAEIRQADDELRNKKSSTKERIEKRQEITIKFIEKLKNQEGDFQTIFKTETGSAYFVSKKGESWRFKKEEGSYKGQPIFKKVFFVSDAEKEKYLDMRKAWNFPENLINHRIKKTDIAEGVFPVELGVAERREAAFEETPEWIKIKGTKTNDGVDPVCSSGIHLGDRITEII